MLDINIDSISNNNAKLMKLSGEFDLSEKERARGSFSMVLSESPSYLIVDLSDVTLLDSSAVGLLISYRTQFEEAGARLAVVVNNNNYLLKKFSNLGIFNAGGIELFGTVQEATQSYAI